MAKKAGIAILALVVMVSLHLFARRWREFAPPGDGYAVTVPGAFAPQEVSFEGWAHSGAAVYEAQAGSFLFVVGRVNLATAPADDQVLRGWYAMVWGELSGDAHTGDPAATSLAAAPGVEVRGRLGNRAQIIRAAYVEQPRPRILFAAVEAEESLVNNGHVDRFFASFRLAAGP